MEKRKLKTLFFSSCIACLALFAFGAASWAVNRAAAQRAALDLAVCRRLSLEIEQLRDAPHTVHQEQQTQQQITLSIQRAAQIAEIPDADILRVTPQSGRRLKNSAHIQQPVDLEIRALTLGQLSRFLTELQELDKGLHPTSIRLTAPRSESTTSQNENETWACEFVLTYLVFSPE
jgi:hypothetical protein